MNSKEVQRRLSLPDLNKLKADWDSREAIEGTAQLAPGKLQVIIKIKKRQGDKA
jgi:hypothetical protein